MDPLIGRSWELDTLISKVELVRYGVSSVATVEGEAGIGKSRLMRELTSRCASLGLDSVAWEAAAAPQFELTPLATLKAFIPRTRPELSLSDLEIGTNYRDEVALASIVTRRVERLCAKRRQQQLILFVEDAHWMDAVTAAVLRRLILQSHLATCVVLSARPVFAEKSDGLESLLTLRETTRVQLRPLETEEIAELIESMELDETLSPSWLDWCGKASSGNPLHAQALARAAEGQTAEAAVAGDDVDTGPIFGRLERVPGDEVMRGRLNQLDDYDVTVLAAASVMGLSFTASSVARLLDRTDDEVQETLERAYQYGLVEQELGARWRFSHALLSNIASTSISTKRREELHRRRASQLRDDPVVSRLELAEQLALGGERGEAIDIYIEEAKGAAELGADREAAALFRKAEALAEDPSEQQRLVEDDARLIRVRTLFAISAYEEANPLLQDELDYRIKQRRASLRRLLKSPFDRLARDEEQLKEVTQVLSVLSWHSTQLGFFQNRFADVLRATFRMVIEVLIAGHTTERGLSLGHLAFVTSIFGLRRLSNTILDLAGRDIRNSWNMAGLVEHALLANIVYSHQGDFERVEAVTSVALEWFEDHEDPLRFEMLLALRSLSHFLRGDFHTAERWHSQCLQSARSSRNLQAITWSLGTLVYCRALQGEPCDDLKQDLERTLKRSMPIADRMFAEGALALLLHDEGYSERWERVVESMINNPVGPYFLLVPADFALSYLIDRLRQTTGEEKEAYTRTVIKLITRLLPGAVATPPMRTVLSVRGAELANVLDKPVLARVVSNWAKKNANEFSMDLFGDLAEVFHPDASDERKQEIVRDFKIAFGSEWHAKWLKRALQPSND